MPPASAPRPVLMPWETVQESQNLCTEAFEMRLWGRKSPTVTVKDIVQGLLMVCIGGQKTLDTDLLLLKEGALSGALSEVDKDAALSELFMMRIALVAYCLQKCLSEKVQEEAREAFSQALHSILTSSANERIRSDPNRAIAELNERCNLYLTAIETSHPSGPGWNVGKVFAELCGVSEPDVQVIGVGSIQFGFAISAILEFLKRCKSEHRLKFILLEPK